MIAVGLPFSGGLMGHRGRKPDDEGDCCHNRSRCWVSQAAAGL